MLFLHERLMATASRQQEVVERVGAIHSYMRKHPGFIGARVARYMGNPNEYLVMRWWRRAEDLAEHQRNPEVPNWGANRPEGIYLEPPKTTRWESVTESGKASDRFFVRTIYKPRQLDSSDLVDKLSQHIQDGTKQGAMSWAQVFKSKEEGDLASAALLLAGFKDRDAFNLYLASSEGDDFAGQQNPFEVVLSGCFEVVEEALPEAAAK